MDRLSALETFICVFETGSFSAASRRLGIGQPAVSKAIMQLEQQLATPLLIRSTRGLTPTEAGQHFYEQIAPALTMLGEAQDHVVSGNAALSGRLRICAPVTFARLHIMPRLHEFMAEHPQLNVDVILDDRPIDLIAEGIDVALRLGEMKDSSLIAQRLASCTMRLLATPDYFSAHGIPVSPDALSAYPAVIYLQGERTDRWIFSQDGTQTTVFPYGRIRVSAAEGVRATVLSGAGLAVASEWMFAPELESGQVITVLDSWSLGKMDLWAVYPGGRMTSSRVRTFTNFVQRLFF
ncbi:LysR family transcriptional regulator [Pectobacterium parmentieri]|uniref:LysR family transcriptional regulator n=1 Tax=Pectobacterium parmentieri TaxID=1905730 RepID=UPI000EB14EF0|nr:LysR family transcriptional regulator [Pectobacterium parmentieri]AYH04851.1 transcriptional regulator [Pectobacterium parmentieri]AYH22375.1 transcriptional regulator [Pectobacterium parmentieri]MBI0550173.1 LysR family transcriptional regulator [Pectobacterium parmentieri]MBI0563359.1 LysR family transcriptional regulator [Pectobacterium parmentieri]MBN3178796.1 LysR family transcriptional regulator [Pectobacterium parmentieri]